MDFLPAAAAADLVDLAEWEASAVAVAEALVAEVPAAVGDPPAALFLAFYNLVVNQDSSTILTNNDLLP